jgi:DNA-binding winged helix-turn-helix (wHTH) protein
VLQELIAHAGSVVTREQLIAVIWPKGVVDFDTSLNTAIRKLRSALGDLADTPRYIETLPRRGYRFIGTLDVAPEVPAPAVSLATVASVPQPSVVSVPETPMPEEVHPAMDPAETEKSDLPPQGPQRRRLPWRILLASVAVVGGLTLLLMRYRSHGVDVIQPQSVVVTTPSAALVNAPAAFTPPAHSIAVLPFVNLSSDKEQEYFADGLAEELLDLLAKTPGLHVIARTSSGHCATDPDGHQRALMV